MNTFEAQILTPEGSLYEGVVTGVKVPGLQGSFEIKSHHASIVSTLEIGSVLVRRNGDPNLVFAVSGGFVEMNDNKLTLLAEAAENVDDIDVERARESRKRALKRMGKSGIDKDRSVQSRLRAENRLKLAGANVEDEKTEAAAG